MKVLGNLADASLQQTQQTAHYQAFRLPAVVVLCCGIPSALSTFAKSALLRDDLPGLYGKTFPQYHLSWDFSACWDCSASLGLVVRLANLTEGVFSQS